MKMLLPGNPVPGKETDPALAFFEEVAPASVKHQREVPDLSRSASEVQTQMLVDVDPEDVVELQFNDGITQWVSAARLQEDMASVGPRAAQIGGVAVPWRPIGAPAAADSRDVSDWVLKGLKVIGFDPVAKTADLAEHKILERFEDKLEPAAGLYPLTGFAAPGTAVTAETQFDKSGTALIFLHGTASSISGSFGEMRSSWSTFGKNYPGRVYGFQHKTLSVSPVANALALARLVPDGATLHLVSHSRGGLVGELFCLGKIGREQLEAFRLKAERRDAEAGIPDAERSARGKARVDELAALQELSDLLARRKYNIERFVRVACPARGTILASGRADLYLSLITSAIGLLVKTSPYLLPVHTFLKAATIEIARRRTRPEGLPGLEAQMPESPLIHLLNNTDLKSEADLAVIAGDIDVGGGFWNSLKVLATNLYYLEKHDLVVNTAAMYAGVARHRGTWALFDEGSDVSHFNYFKIPRTRDRLLSWLAQPPGEHTDSAFKLQTQEAAAAMMSRSPATRSAAGQPTLILVPGFIATRLKDDDGLLWVDQARLSVAGLSPLALNGGAIKTDGIVQGGYQELEQHFSQSYNVLPFPYDWRRSIADAGEGLATELRARHEKGEKKIQIIAHDMGGLVARAMIALHPELWKTIIATGGRLLLLGTPSRGTFLAPRIFWGVEPTLQMLAMLDPRQTKKKICQMFASFPGLVDLLPETEDGRFFDPAWWAIERGQLAAPAKEELQRARALRAQISVGDTNGIVSVAGVGPDTPDDLVFESGAAVWTTTSAGDGVVPYALGTIAGVATHYLNAIHGDLANNATGFVAFEELLATGATNKLPKTPASVGTAEVKGVRRGAEPVLFPTEEALLRNALGRSQRKRPLRSRRLPVLNVAIRHGDLRRAHWPLVVGHYLGDKIVNAEATLDEQFEGRLSHRAALGLYPGAQGTVELVLAPECRPPGALIVGLGQIGEISMEKVRRAIRDAALRYATHLVETPADEKASVPSSPNVGLSALLIGTNGGRALRVIDSVTAIVSGILDANKALEDSKLIDKVCFDTLQIVELYETVAVQALYAARTVAARMGRGPATTQAVVIAPYVQAVGRGRVQPPLNPYDTGWWPRIEITEEVEPGVKPTGNLRFSIPTSRAGLDERITSAQANLIKELVAQAVVRPAVNSSAASQLFELLVPNNLKPRLDVEADNAVIVVDGATAAIPWEMLARRTMTDVEYLGLRMGLLRQFKSSALQPRPPDSRSFAAVVIGDSANPFAPLDGAVREATAVGKLLNASGYKCEPLLRQDFFSNLGAVLTPDYRILHIAAHGLYDPNPDNPSGVVLGQTDERKPMFLSSREIRQMPAMPELVFLNCCFLARLDEKVEREQAQRLKSVNSLAASVAEELINKGVKAVVAAGWAVDDASAEIFASTFYSDMLAGQCFGDAVRNARFATHEKNPDVNTWAAYQCYGSPDFKLEESAAPVSSKKTNYNFGTRTEFLQAIRNLEGATTDGAKRTDKSWLRVELEGLEQALPPMWRDGEILYSLGKIWGELRVFDRAISLLAEALQAEDGLAPFRAAEQWANFEDRLIASQLEGKAVTKEIMGRWQAVEKRIAQLIEISGTRERWSLLAACEKRRAGFVEGKARAALLVSSVAHYEKAYRLSVAANSPDPYPGLNWLTHLYLSSTAKSSRRTLKVELDRLLAATRARIETDPDIEIWRLLSVADASLLQHLVKGDLHEAANVREVKAAYASIFAAGATLREVGSAARQIDFIAEALGHKKSGGAKQKKVIAALQEIRASIEKEK